MPHSLLINIICFSLGFGLMFLVTYTNRRRLLKEMKSKIDEIYFLKESLNGWRDKVGVLKTKIEETEEINRDYAKMLLNESDSLVELQESSEKFKDISIKAGNELVKIEKELERIKALVDFEYTSSKDLESQHLKLFGDIKMNEKGIPFDHIKIAEAVKSLNEKDGKELINQSLSLMYNIAVSDKMKYILSELEKLKQ